MRILRPDQKQWIGEIKEAFQMKDASGKYCVHRVMGQANTSFGKTCCMVYMGGALLNSGSRILYLTHRKELIGQISAELDFNAINHGIIRGGSKKSLSRRAQIASSGTIFRAFRDGKNCIHEFGQYQWIFVDEAHHIASNSFSCINQIWPQARQILVTATPRRLDGKPLGDWADHLVMGPGMRDLINWGALSDFKIIAPPMSKKINREAFRTIAGDYDKRDTSTFMAGDAIMGDIIGHYIKYLHGRTAIAFCTSVGNAEELAARFRAAGIHSEAIDGGLSDAERDRRIEWLGDGRIKVLTSCELISEGFNCPSVFGCIMARPTQSLSMYLQMIGRVLRTHPDKQYAIILDHVGNVRAHGLPTENFEWSLNGALPEPKGYRTKICDFCFSAYTGGGDCPYCGAKQLQKYERGEREELEEIDGELEEIDQEEVSIIEKVSFQNSWQERYQHAKSLDQFKALGEERGYHYRWAWRQAEIVKDNGGLSHYELTIKRDAREAIQNGHPYTVRNRKTTDWL